MRVGGQHHAPAALPPIKDPVPIVQEAGLAPGPVWTVAENLTPHRNSIPAIPTELSRPTVLYDFYTKQPLLLIRGLIA